MTIGHLAFYSFQMADGFAVVSLIVPDIIKVVAICRLYFLHLKCQFCCYIRSENNFIMSNMISESCNS